jgi:hypothetical protein
VSEEILRQMHRAWVVLRREGQPETDVTEDGVSILDGFHDAMALGSGMLEDEEEESTLKLMQALGFSMDPGGARHPYHLPSQDEEEPPEQ